jgi:hypothetical protein
MRAHVEHFALGLQVGVAQFLGHLLSTPVRVSVIAV